MIRHLFWPCRLTRMFGGRRRGERYTVDDDDDDDDAFCRACIDLSDLPGAQKPSSRGKEPDKQCPLDKNELGRATWAFLHTTAAYYPRHPSPQTQSDMNAFIRHFARFYPCNHCAADFRLELQKSPPRLESREALSRWFCDQHNIVNRKLGKPLFDCSLVLQRWRDGWKDGSCDVD